MTIRPANWVFLGDSLTEGVGARRVNFVSELAAHLRNCPAGPHVTEIRLRKVNPDAFNRFIAFNLGGYLNADEAQIKQQGLWLWNLACEGSTLEHDSQWLPLIDNLRPQKVVIFRGALESLIRPAPVRDGLWPWWIPKPWRHYWGMEPRCYFSQTWWRKPKQILVDTLKQKARLRLLRQRPGLPLMALDDFLEHYRGILASIRRFTSHVVILSLLPPSALYFPQSYEYFCQVNQQIKLLAQANGAEFFEWTEGLTRREIDKLYYRDGFHPNLVGAQKLAAILRQMLQQSDAQPTATANASEKS